MRRYKDPDGSYLQVVEHDSYTWAICWIVNIDGAMDEGLFLGESLASNLSDDDAWSTREAERILLEYAKDRKDYVSHVRGKPWSFETRRHASECLALINAALLKGKGKPWPVWALEAEKAGWKPPKGWKP